jgi:hypothetical protein
VQLSSGKIEQRDALDEQIPCGEKFFLEGLQQLIKAGYNVGEVTRDPKK